MERQKAIVLHPYLRTKESLVDTRTNESKLEEAIGLALAIDLDVVFSQVFTLHKITPSTFIGKGKVDEIATYVKAHAIKLVIIDNEITGIQQRNLEEDMGCKVIDRTALILEIFGSRARTKEGRLQVELAAQEYQKSRLVRSWTHLERQRGGSGFLGGPGETQIESDRRAIRDYIAHIRRQLQKVVKTRELHRKSRKKVPYKVVAIVGYTNAGKSTLFNRLTGAQVLAADKLFATLDPTMRVIKLPSGRKFILSDTVGFISNLPTELVAAFRATLEEVLEADIILHVRDVSNPDSEEQKRDVINVMRDLGVEDKLENNAIEVLNKIDMLDSVHLVELKERIKGNNNIIPVSAVTGVGLDKLLEIIDEKTAEGNKVIDIEVDAGNGKVIAWVYANSEVVESHEKDGVMYFKLSISEKNKGKLEKML